MLIISISSIFRWYCTFTLSLWRLQIAVFVAAYIHLAYTIIKSYTSSFLLFMYSQVHMPTQMSSYLWQPYTIQHTLSDFNIDTSSFFSSLYSLFSLNQHATFFRASHNSCSFPMPSPTKCIFYFFGKGGVPHLWIVMATHYELVTAKIGLNNG